MLYFYPKDNTPGCTRQACAFAGAYESFKTVNAVVIEAYGVWQEKKNYGKRFADFLLPMYILVAVCYTCARKKPISSLFTSQKRKDVRSCVLSKLHYLRWHLAIP